MIPTKTMIRPAGNSNARTFMRCGSGALKDYKTGMPVETAAPSFRTKVRALSASVADKYVRRSKVECGHLRAELAVEAESAIGEFLAAPLGTVGEGKDKRPRFAALLGNFLAAFACDALNGTTVRALHRHALRACDARLRRMARAVKLVEPSFFNVFLAEPLTDEAELASAAALNRVLINSRFDLLVARCMERATNGNAKRAAAAHVALLESARAYFVAAAEGRSAELPSLGMVRESRDVATNVARLKRASAAAPQVRADGERFATRAALASGAPLARSEAMPEGKEATTVRESARVETLGRRALYMRLSRLASFIGAPDIAAALGSNGDAERSTYASRTRSARAFSRAE